MQLLLPPPLILLKHFLPQPLLLSASQSAHVHFMHLLVQLIFIAPLAKFHLFEVELFKLKVNFVVMPNDGAPLVEDILFVMNW